MTISSTTSKWTYIGNGATSVYDYTTKIFLETDLEVTVADADGNETTLTLTTDFTVSGVGESSGGSISLVNAGQDWLDGDGDLSDGYTIVLNKKRPLTQETDIRNQGVYQPDQLEDEFDKEIQVDQQQQEEIDRSMRLPITSSSGVSTVLPAPSAGSNIGWDSTATKLENKITSGDLPTPDTNSILYGNNSLWDKGSVDDSTIEISGGVMGVKDDGINNNKLSDESVDSDQYVDGSIDFIHLSSAALSAITAANNPVGTIRSFEVSTNPETLLGFTSTWVAIEEEVIAGYKAGGTFGTLGSLAIGEEAHLLTGAESGTSAHTHPYLRNNTAASAGSQAGGDGDQTMTTQATTASTAANASTAHNNIQPTYVAYLWRRVS